MPYLTIFLVWQKKLEIYLRHQRKNFHEKHYVTELKLSSQNRIKSESYVGYYFIHSDALPHHFPTVGPKFENDEKKLFNQTCSFSN